MRDDPFDRALARTEAARKSAQRTGVRRMMVLASVGIGIFAVIAVIATSFPVGFRNEPRGGTTLTSYFPWIQGGLVLAALVHLVWRRKRGLGPLWAQDWRTRRAVWRDIRHGRAASDERLAALAVETIAGFRATAWMAIPYFVLIGLAAVQRVLGPTGSASPMLDSLLLFLSPGMVAYWTYHLLQGRKAERANRALLDGNHA